MKCENTLRGDKKRFNHLKIRCKVRSLHGRSSHPGGVSYVSKMATSAIEFNMRVLVHFHGG